jgi:hypothetical protein
MSLTIDPIERHHDLQQENNAGPDFDLLNSIGFAGLDVIASEEDEGDDEEEEYDEEEYEDDDEEDGEYEEDDSDEEEDDVEDSVRRRPR